MVRLKTDSRKIVAGDTYVALKGIKTDGHNYIDEAIKKGASKIVAEYGNYKVDTEIVSNTRDYIVDYLDENYNKYLNEITIIGVTGTNGKTTVAYFLYQALNKNNLKCAYIGTNGFYLDEKRQSLDNTLPDIADLYELIIHAYSLGYKYIMLEVSSQGLTYNRLGKIEFDYAIYTNLTQDHLDFHQTMEKYALAKQLLFKKLKLTGKAIVNNDDNYKDYFLLKENKNVTYGFKDSDYKIENHTFAKRIEFTYNSNKINSPLIGKHNIYNMLPVIIILNELNISKSKIKETMKDLKMPDGRMDEIKYKDNSIIIDYAHSPDSFEKIISTFKDNNQGKIYTVFGCTGDRDRNKRPKMFKVATDLSDHVIVTNDNINNEDENQILKDMLKNNRNNNYEVCLDRKKAIIKGINFLSSGDTLLILGKGHEDYIIIGDKKIPFNDKKIVLNYIEKNNIQTNR